MRSVLGLSTDEQVALAESIADGGEHDPCTCLSGLSTEALRTLSMDTSWLDEQVGSVDACGFWIARLGRYLLKCDTLGFYYSAECDNERDAEQVFGDIKRELPEENQ